MLPVHASPQPVAPDVSQGTPIAASLFHYRYRSDSSRCPRAAIAVFCRKAIPVTESPIFLTGLAWAKVWAFDGECGNARIPRQQKGFRVSCYESNWRRQNNHLQRLVYCASVWIAGKSNTAENGSSQKRPFLSQKDSPILEKFTVSYYCIRSWKNLRIFQNVPKTFLLVISWSGRIQDIHADAVFWACPYRPVNPARQCSVHAFPNKAVCKYTSMGLYRTVADGLFRWVPHQLVRENVPLPDTSLRTPVAPDFRYWWSEHWAPHRR